MVAKFNIEYWCTVEQKNILTHGICFGESEEELVTKLLDFYGRRNINYFSFEFFEDFDCDIVESEEFSKYDC